MQYALLIGTKNGKRQLINDGAPVEVRKEFKSMTAKDGFDLLEVIENRRGVTRRRKFMKDSPAKKPAKKASK